jgi:hypothetical protein
MRLRVRESAAAAAASTTDGTTVKIDVDDAITLEALRAACARALRGDWVGAATAASGRSVKVSLNGADDLGCGREENECVSVRALGVNGGDLVRCVFDEGASAGANANARAASENALGEAMTMDEDDDASAGDGTMMNATPALSVSIEDVREIPQCVRELLERGSASEGEVAFVAAHALMLHLGARVIGEVELSEGLARRGCFSVRYALPIPGSEEKVTCAVRAQPVDAHLSMIGTLEVDSSVAYATLLNVNEYVTNVHALSIEQMRGIWAKVNDGMVSKLFAVANAQAAGVLSRGTLMSLPSDIKSTIVSHMDAYGLAYCACTCKELHSMCSRDEFWEPLLRRDFGVERPELGGRPLRSAYNRLAIERSIHREAQLRAESYHPMPGRLPRHGEYIDPERDIYPGHLPGHVPGIIGGDYDLWPGGLNPNPPGYGRGGLGGPGRMPDPRGGWPGGGPPFPPQPGGLPYRPDPDADLRNPLGGRGRGGRGHDPRFPGMPPNPGWDGRPRPPPDFF